MSAKPQNLYSEKTVQSLEQQLEQLAAKPKGMALRRLIERLKPRIRAAQAAGHSYEDIVQTLSESGVPIRINTLKQYLREPNPVATVPVRSQKTPPAAAPRTTQTSQPGSKHAKRTRK